VSLMVKINTINERCVFLYKKGTPYDTYVGTVKTALSFNDVRIQIMKEGSGDYYIVFGLKVIPIDKNGSLSEWPVGLFDTWDKQLTTLLGWGL
jgi:hypothetical protein